MGQRLWLWIEGFGFAGEVEDWFVGSWREVSRLSAKSKARGSLAMGSPFFLSLSLSLSLSLFVRRHDLTLTFSLSVFQKMIFEGKIKTEIILHPTHGQIEKHFRKMYFSCATKHPHFRKSISGISLKPKQMEPTFSFLSHISLSSLSLLLFCVS